jgi:hypothetical protein
MNTPTLLQIALFPFAAATLLATGMTAARLTGASAKPTPDDRVIDLPIVTVRPDAHDLAHYRAHRIVDLPPITVRPESVDLAPNLASSMPPLRLSSDASALREHAP